ncbi:MAG: S41 family peptidase [Peptoniphilaceae bacterium]|nr:S41 family peptidase [Peptoniphilaceae bacterium]MDD7383200.1 S41 family peptidase [Peptoniphilaceae bacterium]MDY3738424.1 S41 family peptidase [Peptoniphilaceae bacterium]
MKKLTKFILILFSIFILNGCIQRRYNALENNRNKDLQLKDLVKNTNEYDENTQFFPDDVKQFHNYKDYFAWYDTLKSPPLLTLPAPEKPKKLTKEQMIEDYEYFFKIIKENYPFISIINREYGYNFIDNHDKYLSMIKSCKNDEDFYSVIVNIVSDLKSQHAIIADQDYLKVNLDHFSHYWQKRSMFLEFLYMNTQTVRNRYNLEGEQIATSSSSSDNLRFMLTENAKSSTIKNLEIKEISENILQLRINEMLPDYKWDDDKQTLNKLLRILPKYKALVIDIRGNGGGNIDYWQEFLLPRIISKSYSTKNYMFFKGGDRNKIILEDPEFEKKRVSDVDINSMNLDYVKDLNDFEYFVENKIKVTPDNSINYSGNIYLLVDDGVYSAAESLASFCKNTKLATLVGQTTGGDGVTIGVINDYLPNSGYVFSFTNALGYAQDGSLNEEEKTKPDIETANYNTSIEIIKKNEGENDE